MALNPERFLNESWDCSGTDSIIFHLGKEEEYVLTQQWLREEKLNLTDKFGIVSKLRKTPKLKVNVQVNWFSGISCASHIYYLGLKHTISESSNCEHQGFRSWWYVRIPNIRHET